MKYDIKFTNQFKRDIKPAKKLKRNLDKLIEEEEILAVGTYSELFN